MIGVFRFIHIFAAIFWVGTTLFMVLFLEPTVRAMGPAGGNFMRQLTGGTRFNATIAASGGITVLAGLILYFMMFGWQPAVLFGARLPLTIGAIAGFAAAFVGGRFQGRASREMLALSSRMESQGGPPQPDQLAQMASLQATLRRGGRISAILMLIAVIGMTW